MLMELDMFKFDQSLDLNHPNVSGNLVTGLGGLKEQGEQQKGRMVLKGNSIPCDCHSSDLQALLSSPHPWLIPRDLKCVTPEGGVLPLGPPPPARQSLLCARGGSRVMVPCERVW